MFKQSNTSYVEKPIQIELDDKTVLKQLEMSKDKFLNKMTIIYGQSESGKTTILKDIMFHIKDHISNVFAIVPTNDTNGAYDGLIPDMCIKPGYDTNETIKFLSDFVTRQKNLTKIYNTNRDLDKLKHLFEQTFDTTALAKIKYLDSETMRAINLIENNSNFSDIDKLSKREKLISDRNEQVRNIYLKAIEMARLTLSRSPNLNNDDKQIIEFLKLDPHALLILDDCSSRFKTWVKADPVTFKDLFYLGRHYNISTIILTQDDKPIDTEFRKNTMCSIFTEQQSAITNFGRASNGYSKNIKKYAEMCIKKVFTFENKDQIHRKLVFLKSSTEPFCIMQAKQHMPFRVGNSACWEMCKRIQERSKKIESKNELLSQHPHFK